MERLNSDFVEKMIINGIYNYPEYREKALSAFKDVYFDDPNASHIFKFIKNYQKEYNDLPKISQVINSSEVPDDIKDYLISMRDIYNDHTDIEASVNFIFDQSEKYLREKSIKQAIIESVDDVEENPDKVFERIEDIKGLSLNGGQSKFQMTFPWNGANFQDRNDVDIRKYWLYPLVPKEGHILGIAGEKGAGKTWVAMKIVDAIAKNEDFCIWKGVEHDLCVPSGARVLYLDGEMSKEEMKPRTIELNTNENFIPYQYMDIANDDKREKLQDTEYREFVLKTIIEQKFQIVVLDNIISLFLNLEIMGTQDWSPINEWLLELRMNNIFVITIDHMGKDKNKGAMGTQSKIFNLDDVIYLTRPTNYKGPNMKCEFNVEYSRTRGALPLDDQWLMTGTKVITLEDGEWTVEGYESENSAITRREDLLYKAITRLLIDPNIWKSNLHDHLNVGKNHKIIKQLLEGRYITILSGEGTRYEEREVTEFGHAWHREQQMMRGENDENDE